MGDLSSRPRLGVENVSSSFHAASVVGDVTNSIHSKERSLSYNTDGMTALTSFNKEFGL